MPKQSKSSRSSEKKELRVPIGRDAALNQTISIAYDLAREQLSNGTASSQTLNFFLKKGSRDSEIELEILEEQKKLIQAKTAALEAQKNSDIMYREAIAAFSLYSGKPELMEEPDEDF